MSVDVKYRTSATATGGRDGTASTEDGSFSVKLATPKELGGAGGDGNNPEQLFAAGYSACFLGAMKAVAGSLKLRVPAETTVTATVGIGPRSEGGFGITADLCTMAKIVAGGLPGGALAGRRDIMEGLDFAATKAAGRERVSHQGTYNANPLAAAAGIATLEKVATTDACACASEAGARLRTGMNDVLVHEAMPWAVYGQHSLFHVFTNPKGLAIDAKRFDPLAIGFEGLKKTKSGAMANKLRLAMLIAGVDIMGAPGGVISATHGDREIEQTVGAFQQAVRMIKEERDEA